MLGDKEIKVDTNAIKYRKKSRSSNASSQTPRYRKVNGSTCESNRKVSIHESETEKIQYQK